MRKLFSLVLTVLCGALFIGSQEDPFVEKPYLQLGDRSKEAASEGLTLLWHAAPGEAKWQVQIGAGAGKWRDAEVPTSREVALPGMPPHWVFQAELTGLKPGSEFQYRVLRDNRVVFESTATARKSVNQSFSFVAFGDCAAGTPEQRAVAYQAYLQHPDFLFITGDIVYSRGRIAEYRQKFFPVYNSDAASPEAGAPLLRSVLFLAAPGNHDISNRNLTANPDGLAYFYYWMQPLNGPAVTETVQGDSATLNAFRTAAGSNFPRMTNFSFDYGNSHWVVLDSNPYVDVRSSELTQWVEQDLEASKKARWKFVAFHHPGFSSSKTHFQEQQMRLMATIFERHKVDVVFAGHVHNYQRTYPLTFKLRVDHGTAVDGEWKLDKKFDGVKHTRPEGVLYLVSGAGGAGLYNPEQQSDPASWQEFTYKYIADTHSLT
ncbi:MAG: metallophosphoesterase family protein, partial [Acidobacteriota bacterium]|nr:metallophosphoesterase family protein [Acidobacteriota bacterium]